MSEHRSFRTWDEYRRMVQAAVLHVQVGVCPNPAMCEAHDLVTREIQLRWFSSYN